MNYVAYYRVSTQKQGRSGLGLEAQQSCVESYCAGKGEIIAGYVDIESGKNDSRPELAKAIDHAKSRGATLIVGKLDRLSRSVSFIFQLRDADVKFHCVDLPEFNTLTLAIFAAMAQHERELISQRTKAALAARRERGLSLGNPGNLGGPRAIENSRLVRARAARESIANIRATELALLHRERGLSQHEIARQLNANGHRTGNGKLFTQATVSRLLRRADACDRIAA